MQPNATFRSQWFDGLVTVLSVDESKNELHVSIDPEKPGRSAWPETWNLAHTKVGLANRGYYHYESPENNEP